MRGKIIIEAVSEGNLTVDMQLQKVGFGDKIAVFDALVRGFDLDSEDRAVIGMIIAIGGPGGLPGMDVSTVELHPELTKLLREKREGSQ